MSVLIPHFDLPFRFNGTAVAVVEQGTVEEISNCVQAIVRTPVGTRLELTDFGIPDQTFALNGADPALIVAAVAQWEPRAVTVADQADETLDQFVTKIVLNIQGGAQ